MFLQASSISMSVSPQYAVRNAFSLHRFLTVPTEYRTFKPSCYSKYHSDGILLNLVPYSHSRKLPYLAVSSKSNSEHDPQPSADSKVKPKSRSHSKKAKASEKEEENGARMFPSTIPRKPRRGRRSEAAALEDFVRNTLEQTFASIRQQNAEVMENKENVFKERADDKVEFDSSSDDDDDEEEEEIDESDGTGRKKKKKMVVEEEDPNWPLDADVGWGVRASEYFEQHPIKNVVGDDGVEINWEGEIDDNWVKEINCLEWESFAFHPSPLVVLVFERYNRCSPSTLSNL